MVPRRECRPRRAIRASGGRRRTGGSGIRPARVTPGTCCAAPATPSFLSLLTLRQTLQRAGS
ncbi:hypothetical protein FOA52_016015 [Chlamydomonas sp. UWO 241]|nr:hypothetical protein FOA52_016015 [Chlamydomonas sp. UWO 241]